MHTPQSTLHRYCTSTTDDTRCGAVSGGRVSPAVYSLSFRLNIPEKLDDQFQNKNASHLSLVRQGKQLLM